MEAFPSDEDQALSLRTNQRGRGPFLPRSVWVRIPVPPTFLSRARRRRLRRVGRGRGGGFLVLGHRLAEEVFDLAVHAAEFLRGPGLELFPEIRADPQEECFFGVHA